MLALEHVSFSYAAPGVAAAPAATGVAVLGDNSACCYAAPASPAATVAPRAGNSRANWLLNDISYQFAPGSRTAIVGPSGCGKSTLLRLLAGLITPSAGRVISAATSVVFQEPRLCSWLNVLQNAAFSGCELEHARKLLEICQIAHLQHAMPQQLSGGQAARVAFARALAARSDYLLLDEPFAALDYFTASYLREWLSGVLAEQKRALVLITHNIAEALELCESVLVLKNAQLHAAPRTEREILNLFKEKL